LKNYLFLCKKKFRFKYIIMNKIAKLKNLFLYGYSRLRSLDASDEYTNWLSFAVPGMMNKGNLYCFEFAARHLPTNSPIVEIGSFCGLSTNLISYYLRKYNKTNRIISSDKWIFEGAERGGNLPATEISHAEYRNFIKQTYIRNIKMFSSHNLPFTIEEFSDDFFALWEKQSKVSDILGREISLGGKIAFCFIDGNHSYEFARRDFENTDRWLENGGFVFFDDSADYYQFGSSKLMNEIKRNKNYELILKNPNYLFRKK